MLEIKDGKSKIFLGMHNGLKCIFLSNLLIRLLKTILVLGYLGRIKSVRMLKLSLVCD